MRSPLPEKILLADTIAEVLLRHVMGRSRPIGRAIAGARRRENVMSDHRGSPWPTMAPHGQLLETLGAGLCCLFGCPTPSSILLAPSAGCHASRFEINSCARRSDKAAADGTDATCGSKQKSKRRRFKKWSLRSQSVYCMLKPASRAVLSRSVAVPSNNRAASARPPEHSGRRGRAVTAPRPTLMGQLPASPPRRWLAAGAGPPHLPTGL